jgi:hypothetical protein
LLSKLTKRAGEVPYISPGKNRDGHEKYTTTLCGVFPNKHNGNTTGGNLFLKNSTEAKSCG